jgi:hypothetical protein
VNSQDARLTEVPSRSEALLALVEEMVFPEKSQENVVCPPSEAVKVIEETGVGVGVGAGGTTHGYGDDNRCASLIIFVICSIAEAPFCFTLVKELVLLVPLRDETKIDAIIVPTDIKTTITAKSSISVIPEDIFDFCPELAEWVIFDFLTVLALLHNQKNRTPI